MNAYTDGFFYHPDGATLAAIVGRIASGEINPRLDDVFALALQETKDEKHANSLRIRRLRADKDAIDKEIARLEKKQLELDDRFARQHRAIGAYQETGEIDEILTPDCDKLVADERKKDVRAEFDEVEVTLPDGWEECGKRVDDDFLYVTMRRRRSPNKAEPPAERVKSKVAKALDLFRAPTFDRRNRIQLPDRLATMSPINPGAP